jgi:signal peptidase I
MNLQKLWRQWRGFLLFATLMLVFRSAVADYMYVPSGSMNPTLMDGDRIAVDKRVYGWRLPFTLTRLTDGRNPRRGEIVIFESPADGKTLVKRVIGLPGDVVAMHDDQLTINGHVVAYRPAQFSDDAEMVAEFRDQPHVIGREALGSCHHLMMILPDRAALRTFGPVTVPPGHYWMMGDNRDDSDDSRFIGPVSRRLIFGRVTQVLVSLNPDHHWLPRADRWFEPLI